MEILLKRLVPRPGDFQNPVNVSVLLFFLFPLRCPKLSFVSWNQMSDAESSVNDALLITYQGTNHSLDLWSASSQAPALCSALFGGLKGF